MEISFIRYDSLAENLERIEGLPLEARVNKDEAIRSLLESYKGKNPLVAQVANGETSFAKLVQDAYEKYGGIWMFLPQSLDEHGRKALEELADVVGYIDQDSFGKMMNNPLGFGIPFGTIAYAAGLLAEHKVGDKEEITRRQFFRRLSTLTGAGGLVAGGAMGAQFSFGKYFRYSLAMKNAQYVDNKIAERYTHKA